MPNDYEGRLKSIESSMLSFEARLREADDLETMEQLRHDYRQFKKDVLATISDLRSVIQGCNDEIDRLETYSRKNCLLLHGIKESKDENIVDVTMSFLNNLNIPDFQCDARMLDNCHRLRSKNAPRPIIVKFNSYLDRKKVWTSKKLLKGTKTFISESLTKRRAALYKRARESFGGKQVWTRDGDIMVAFPSGKKMTVNNETLLDKAIDDLSRCREFSDKERERDKERSRYNTRQATGKLIQDG